MVTFITVAALGVLVCVIGAINMTGNISSLHRYHRHRVSEEDRIPFGRMIGLGTLSVGVSLIVFGVLNWIAGGVNLLALPIVATVVLIVGIVVGLGIAFYAMFKYNKGIF